MGRPPIHVRTRNKGARIPAAGNKTFKQSESRTASEIPVLTASGRTSQPQMSINRGRRHHLCEDAAGDSRSMMVNTTIQKSSWNAAEITVRPALACIANRKHNEATREKSVLGAEQYRHKNQAYEKSYVGRGRLLEKRKFL